MDFAASLKTYIDSVDRRDLDSFMSTLHEDVTVVLPNGRILAGRDEVGSFHREWFVDRDWRLDHEVVRTSVHDDVGTALLLVDYHDADADGNPYHKRYVLALVFARFGELWLLVHDQNTITEPA